MGVASLGGCICFTAYNMPTYIFGRLAYPESCSLSPIELMPTSYPTPTFTNSCLLPDRYPTATESLPASYLPPA
eukprot:239929-Rhodomonas_salina.2